MSVNAKMTAIANAVRSMTGETSPISLDRAAQLLGAQNTAGLGFQEKMANIADVIRERSGISGSLNLDEMSEAIAAMDGEETIFYISVATDATETKWFLRFTESAHLHIDWGNGAITDSDVAAGDLTYTSAYDSGDYLVKFKATPSGTLRFGNALPTAPATTGNHSVKRILLGKDAKIVLSYGFSPAQTTALQTLTDFSMGDNVTSIYNYAFANCSNLKNICLSKNLNFTARTGAFAFMNCTSLKSLFLPPSVTYIPESCFKGCSAMQYFDFSAHTSVPTLANVSAFASTPSSCKILVPEELYWTWKTTTPWSALGSQIAIAEHNANSTYIYAYPYNPVTLNFSQSAESSIAINWGDGSGSETVAGTGLVTVSHTYAYPDNYVIILTPSDGCTMELQNGTPYGRIEDLLNDSGHIYNSTDGFMPDLDDGIRVSKIYFSNKTINISDCCLAGEEYLKEVHIADGIDRIGDYAFCSCAQLTSVQIPNSITSIGKYAFYGNELLTSVNIPNKLTEIKEGTFAYCELLQEIKIPHGVASIGKGAFRSCTALQSVNIPPTITSIGEEAFYGCSSLTSAEIPSTVSTIERYAFYRCGLSDVTIPKNITVIPYASFGSCGQLKTVTIPRSVERIEYGAFYQCTAMECYDFSQHESIPVMEDILAFDGMPSACHILVPSALYDKWITAENWSAYAANIVAV